MYLLMMDESLVWIVDVELFQVCFDTLSIDSDFDRIFIGNSLLLSAKHFCTFFPVLAICFDQYHLKSLLM